jgi:hypothetical protein
MDIFTFGSLAAIWLRSSNGPIVCWRRLALCIAVGISGIVIARILQHQQSIIVSYTFFAIGFVGLLGLSLVSKIPAWPVSNRSLGSLHRQN